MFQRVFAFLTIITCIIIIFVGYLSWNEKVGETAKGTPNGSITENTNSTFNEKGEEQHESLTFEQVKEAVVNLPESVQQVFKEAYVNKEQVNIAFVGSESMGFNEGGWSIIAKNELENFYGLDLLNVKIYEFDGTSTEFLNSELSEQIIKEAPHIVFLETFRLADNSGFVTVEIAQQNLTTFMKQLNEEVPYVEFIIQPPNPLVSAVNYPKEVEKLKEFFESSDTPYFNHWENWPTSDSEIMEQYLNNGLPNEKGHALWADAVINYFISR